MADKPGFMLYHNDFEIIKETFKDNADIGELIIMLFDYSKFGKFEESENPLVNFSFKMMKQKIDMGNEKYNSIVEKRRKAGIKSSEIRRANANFVQQNKQVLTSVNKCQQNELNINKDINIDINKDININKNINNNTSSTDDESIGVVYSDSFNKFWQAYPKRIGKGGAFTAFKKLKVNNKLLDEIISALDKQKQSNQWQKDNGQFIPNPSTWLNQRRWEDDTDITNNTVNTKLVNGMTADEMIEKGLNPFEYF